MQSLLTSYPILGLKPVSRPEGQCPFVIKSTCIQASKLSSAWNDYDCPCGWTQRRQFARRIDPEYMFVDDDDEMTPDENRTVLEDDDDNTEHILLDAKVESDLQVMKAKRAKQDEGEDLMPWIQQYKRQRQHD